MLRIRIWIILILIWRKDLANPDLQPTLIYILYTYFFFSNFINLKVGSLPVAVQWNTHFNVTRYPLTEKQVFLPLGQIFIWVTGINSDFFLDLQHWP